MKFSCFFGGNFFLNVNHITKLYAVMVWENVVLSYCDL
jgi:hypothetical protein